MTRIREEEERIELTMSPPGFRIYIWPPVTLIFGLLTPRSTVQALAMGETCANLH